jgi:class 3 adenylate cyclase/tetratricopeptide (TPR) repeat protein
MDVANWLKTLGLEQFESSFRDNGIDAELLPKLTAEDLKDLGVTRVGDRRRLLEAILALRNEGVPPPASAEPLMDHRQAPGDAERRQITVLFCDLVGSTDLAARLDPEDLRVVITAFQRMVAETATRFGGFVAKYMGDGALVYFGYPRALEHDAERAVRAGLTLAEAATAIEAAKTTLRVRVGVATGLVVVGDLLGTGPAQERTVVGETPNLAARLQSLAEPDAVLVCPMTRRLVGDLFAFRDMGTHSLKGFPTSVPVTLALGESASPDRFEALRAPSLTPLIGREEQLALLQRRWERAKAGAGQVVLISGEPGVGKSRLTRALEDGLRGERLTRLRYFCSPHHVDTALYPFVSQLEQAAGIARGDAPSRKLEKLKTLIAPSAASNDDFNLFAGLLSLQSADGQTSSEPGSSRERERKLRAFVRQIEMLAARLPTLMIFEDAHWSDPTSIELLNVIFDKIRAHRVLLIATYRPELQPQWGGEAHVATMLLNRLDAPDTAEFARRVAGGKALPPAVLDQIVHRTDGVPLFIEELTRSILESGVLQEKDGRYLLEAPLLAEAIPSSLQASLLARLDRLAPTRRIAQIGSALGREFSHQLLSLVAGGSEAELLGAIGSLIDAGLLSRRGVPPDAIYAFKHALVQDAAYSTLLHSARQTLHARIAAALEQNLTEVAQTRPELLAHHYAEARAPAKAAGYWLEAGRNNARRSAHVEAARSFERAIAAIRELPDDPMSRRMELDVRLAQTPSLMTINMAAARTGEAARRAILLCEEFGELPRALPAFFALASNFSSSGDLVSATEQARRVVEIGAGLRDGATLMLGHRFLGSGSLWLGDLDAARQHLEAALSHADHLGDRAAAVRVDFDHYAAALTTYGHLKLRLGDLEAGWRLHDEAWRIAKEKDYAFTVAFVLLHQQISEAMTSNLDSFRRSSRIFAEVCEQRDVVQWRDTVELLARWGAAKATREEVAVPELLALIARLKSAEWRLQLPFCLRLAAEMLILAGAFEAAGELLDDTDRLVKSTKQIWITPQVYRLRGTLAERAAAGDGAEGWLERALAQAREHGETYFELLAARDLARLYAGRGQPRRAGELLAAVCGKFAAPTENADLHEARALLRQVELSG